MKNSYKLVGFLMSLTLLGGVLAGCDDSTCPDITDTNALYTTPETDKLKFAYEDTYATTNFNVENTHGVNYGKATLVSVTDGDTANFTTIDGTYYKVRFLGINTPESTAKVEAWGVKASKWMASVFESAVDFCLVCDADAYGTKDSSGSRALAFVWYKTSASDENHPNSWRLYNLECVEQAYSKNQLFTDSSLKYLDSFLAAEERGEKCGGRVYGQTDPDFVGSSTIIEVSCYYVRHHFDEIGISFQEGSSGSYLYVTGLVVGMMGDNFVIRDLKRDLEQDETDALECLYVYAGYNTSMASKIKVGYIVSFYCRASKYPKNSENVQLTDISTANYGKYKFVSIKPTDAKYAELLPDAPSADMDPYVKTPAPTTYDELSEYYGYYTKLRVKVRMVNQTVTDEDGNEVEVNNYYRESISSTTKLVTATTIYAWLDGSDGKVVCNIRLDASTGLTYSDFGVDQVWEFKAYLSKYYDNYQIQAFTLDKTIGNAVKIS